MRETLMVGFAGCYLHLVTFLCRSGAPSWLVNLPQILLHALVPDSFRLDAFSAWMRRYDAGKGGAK